MPSIDCPKPPNRSLFLTAAGCTEMEKTRTYNVRSDLAAENRVHGNHLCGSERCVIRSEGKSAGSI